MQTRIHTHRYTPSPGCHNYQLHFSCPSIIGSLSVPITRYLSLMSVNLTAALSEVSPPLSNWGSFSAPIIFHIRPIKAHKHRQFQTNTWMPTCAGGPLSCQLSDQNQFSTNQEETRCASKMKSWVKPLQELVFFSLYIHNVSWKCMYFPLRYSIF